MLAIRWGHGARASLAVVGVLAVGAVSAGPSVAADGAEVYIVQGLPDRSVDVAVDGKTVAEGVETAEVAGPFKVRGGEREVRVTDGGKVVLERTFAVKAKSSWDVVIHLPASASGDPVATVFRNDLEAVPKGKASVVVAHTAAVPPADIKVNGDVLFANVANGESLKLTVPAATYEVTIVPTGESKPVIFGPVDLSVKGGSLNRVYAVGDPEADTMGVAVHVIPVRTTGSKKPARVDTGTGGQAVGVSPALVPPLIR